MARQLMADLLTAADLPEGFAYPPEYLRAVDLGLVALEPWWLLTGDRLRQRFAGLQRRYGDRRYVPFAERQDNDDIACWAGSPPDVLIVHDHASPGWELRGREPIIGFHAWLRQAVEDFIEWGEIELGL
jgi:hypothetical protein